ncbi:MAG: hypothetical protein VX498_08500 [Myxococcota bacterium]|nr:hypothetical protein [Myxococcota bacterium]
MNRFRLSLLVVLAALLLAGCSDYSLHLAVPPPVPSSGPALQPPGLGNDPPVSPWGSLDPGSFPEALFALVWNDPREGCLDCPNPFFLYERPRYDILDAQGRVLVRFELPWQDVHVTHRSLHPAGPGRFLADSSLYDPDDPRYRKIWFGDGLSGEVDLVLEMGSEPEVYLPQADRVVVMPQGFHSAHVRPDPQDPDRIYLMARLVSLTEEILQARLYSIDVRDPEAPVFEWYPEDMIAEARFPQEGETPLYPWVFETFADGDDAVLVLGIQEVDHLDSIPGSLVSFSPDTGPGDWTLDVTGRVLMDAQFGRELAFRPPLGDQPGQAVVPEDVSMVSGNCNGPGFATLSGQESMVLESSDSLACVRIGTQLEPSSSTFLYYGEEVDPEFPNQARLVLSHRGQDVWDYRTFRDGLVDRPFDLQDLVQIDLPRE